MICTLTAVGTLRYHDLDNQDLNGKDHLYFMDLLS